MFYIGDGLELAYLKADDELKLSDYFNVKRFTAKDTPLSYRQVNTLGTAKIISEERENKAGWRKFSFKELVFILILRDLKKFGLQNSQLKQLSEFFLSEKYKYWSDVALGTVFRQVEVPMKINFNGDYDVFDPNFYFILSSVEWPYIEFSLNQYVNEILSKQGGKALSVVYSVDDARLRLQRASKEEQVLKIIKDKAYSTLTIKKKDGEISVIYAEKTKTSKKQPTEKEILELMKAKDFQDINVIKRDGKIVNYTVSETIKL